jgi:uncharacterized membrane protein
MAGLLAIGNTIIAALYRQAGLPELAETLPLVFDVPLALAAGGYLLALVVASYHSLVATRTFVAGARERFPDGAFTRNVPLGLANILIGGVVYSALVGLGTLALLVPGLVAYVAFLFMLPYIAAEDRNFVDALQSSYRLSKGNWLLLFALVVIVVSMAGLLGAVGGVVSVLLLPPTVGQLAIVAVQAPVSVYVLAVIAAAFNQLRADGDGPGGPAPDAEPPSAPA